MPLEGESRAQKTVLFVTHDLEEAIALSDEVAVLSAGPGSQLVNRYQVNLRRPRDLIDIRTQPEFIELYRHIWADLKQEVLKSYERNQAAEAAAVYVGSQKFCHLTGKVASFMA